MVGLLILVALALLTFRKKGQAPTNSIILDKVSTQELKGIAIILVILGHMSIDRHIFLIPNMVFAGAWGVTLFLLLSGFGVAKSYLQSGINFRTSFRRYRSVLIPYSIVTLVWILIDTLYLGKDLSGKTIFLALMGIDVKRSIDASMWYISMILFWYIAFYLIFKLPLKKNFLKIILLFLVAFVIFKGYLSPFLEDLSYNWQLSAFSFPLGVTIALYTTDVKKLINDRVWKVFAFLSLPVLFMLFIILIPYNGVHILVYIFTNTAISLFLMILFALLKSYQWKSAFFLFIGAISFEIYLFEGVFMWKYSLLRIYDSKLISFTLYFGVLLLVSYFYNKLTQKIKFPARERRSH
jgi:peptidoglycan/LPS O-acetylase OafA/YrhL